MEVVQSCLTLCDSVDYTVHGILQARTLEGPFPSPVDLPNPGIEPRSPSLQVDSLPAELSALRGAGYDQEDFTSQGWGRKIPGEGVAPAKAEKPKGQLCRGVCFRADRVRRNRGGLRGRWATGWRISKCIFSSAFIRGSKTSKPRQILGASLSAKEFFFWIV